MILVGTGMVGHMGPDVFTDRSVCKEKFPGEPQPVLAETAGLSDARHFRE